MRVNTVQSARKAQGRCESCGHEINKGDAYKSISPRYGGKRKRHMSCPSWRPSEMTSSKIATAYAGQEAAHDALDALDPDEYLKAVDEETAEHPGEAAVIADVQQILAECAEAASECRDDYQDGFDNMPENFQAGPTGEEIQEKIDMLDAWAGDLESWSASSDEPDEGQTFEEWFEEVIDSAREVVDALEL